MAGQGKELARFQFTFPEPVTKQQIAGIMGEYGVDFSIADIVILNQLQILVVFGEPSSQAVEQLSVDDLHTELVMLFNALRLIPRESHQVFEVPTQAL